MTPELTGMVLPDGVTVEVHEEALTHLHPVVPAQASDGEIAEEDLELVAGGSACWDHCGCSVSFASPAGLRFGA